MEQLEEEDASSSALPGGSLFNALSTKHRSPRDRQKVLKNGEFSEKKGELLLRLS